MLTGRHVSLLNGEVMILGVTGPARSGKNAVGEYLQKEYLFKLLNFSEDVFDPLMKERGIKITKMNRAKFGDDFRKEKGRAIFAELILEKIDSPLTVITGFRSPEEVELLRSKTAEFHLILVDTKPDTRFERRSDIDPKEETEFFERDKMDEKKGTEEVFLMADQYIENNGDFDKLHEKIDRIMDDLLAGDDK